MKEEKFPHTRKPLRGWPRWGSFRATEESTAIGCGGQSGEIPAQRNGADQHSPGQEACLLTHRGGQGWEPRLGLQSNPRRGRGVGGVNTA